MRRDDPEVPFKDELLERFLVRLMACNADDGTACNMAGMGDMRSAFEDAHVDFQRLFPAGPNAQYFNLLRYRCLGAPDLPLAPKRPVAPPFSDLKETPVGVPMVSTVVTFPTLLRLMSDADKIRFEKKSIRFNVTGGKRGSDLSNQFEEKLVARLGALPSEHRHFRIADDEAHGRPYVWFTAKEDLETNLEQRKGRGHSNADIARDLLGLGHHGTASRETGGRNHLVALDIPASVVEKAGYMRPAAPQAFDNRRFILRFDENDRRSRRDWGHTLDLDLFATSSAGRPVGARERVLLRLQASLFEGDARIAFTYLGFVQTTRGTVSGRDDDDAFLTLVRRRRNADQLVERMCR